MICHMRRAEPFMPKAGSRGHAQETIIRFPQCQRPHESVPEAAQTVELGAVLIALIERCHRRIAPDLTIRLSATPGRGALIGWEEAATLDFVVREIVSNAYRYAHPA